MEKNNGLKLEYIHLGQENYKALSDLCNTYYRTEGRTSQANAVCGEVRGYLKTLGVGENRYPALEQRVNEQFGDIMKHFRQEHPNHREPFYQTACYLFAGFKSRTIALILNQDEQNLPDSGLRPFWGEFKSLYRLFVSKALIPDPGFRPGVRSLRSSPVF